MLYRSGAFGVTFAFCSQTGTEADKEAQVVKEADVVLGNELLARAVILALYFRQRNVPGAPPPRSSGVGRVAMPAGADPAQVLPHFGEVPRPRSRASGSFFSVQQYLSVHMKSVKAVLAGEKV